MRHPRRSPRLSKASARQDAALPSAPPPLSGKRQDMSETGTFVRLRWHNRRAGLGSRLGVSSMESPAVLRKCKYAFLTLANYSLIAVANAIEPLRMANRVMGQEIYEWPLVSLDGRTEEASGGLNLSPTMALEKIGR